MSSKLAICFYQLADGSKFVEDWIMSVVIYFPAVWSCPNLNAYNRWVV